MCRGRRFSEARFVPLLCILVLALAGFAQASPATRVLRLEAKGSITPPLSRHLRDGIAAAESFRTLRLAANTVRALAGG